MKTSNKIFLSFLIFLFGGITLLFVCSKYYKDQNDKSNFAIQEKKTPPFSVIVVESNAFVVVKNGKEFKVSQSYRKDQKPDFARFEVRNDTLFVFATKSSIQGKWFVVPEVYCKNVKFILAKEKSNVNMDYYQIDSLSVNLNKSDFFCNVKKSVFVNLDAKDSHAHIHGDSLSNINLKLNKSRLNINFKTRIKEISGSLKNNSNIEGSIQGKITLEKDKSSNISLWN